MPFCQWPQLIGDVWRHLLFPINAFLNDCPYPVVYRIEVWSIGRPHIWCEVRSLVSQQLLCTRGTLESKSHLTDVWQQLFEQQDMITVIVMYHLLSPIAAWKPHQCSNAWRHWLKLTCRNMFIRNQQGMFMSWNGIWLKYGQQPAEIHWSIDRSVTRLFYCMSQSQKQTLWTFAMMCFFMRCNSHDF